MSEEEPKLSVMFEGCRHSSVLSMSQFKNPIRYTVKNEGVYVCPDCQNHARGECANGPEHTIMSVTYLPPPIIRQHRNNQWTARSASTSTNNKNPFMAYVLD